MPSKLQLISATKKHILSGAEHITLTWGENEIRLEKQKQWIGHDGPWTGEGWIRKNGGYDLAAELNKPKK